MTATPPDVPGAQTPEGYVRAHPSPPRKPLPASGIRAASVLTVVSLAILAISMWELLRGDLSTIVAEICAAVALAAFGFAIYGLLRMILALIESAGERRRRTREFTERRLADRDGKSGVKPT